MPVRPGAPQSLPVGLLQAGDHVVCGQAIYSGTKFIMEQNLTRVGMNVEFVDMADPAAVEQAVNPKTKMIYFETPTNPTMQLADIKTISEIGKRHGVRVVVDNTFAPPPVQYPMDLGVDLVIHSLTKYINGHGDIVGGVVIGREEDIIAIKQNAMVMMCGSPLSPFSAYMILRGLKTYHLRLKRHCDNAMALANFLEKHDRIARVNYPGLPSHPQHELALKQMNNEMFGGMLSFEIQKGSGGMETQEMVEKLMANLTLPKLAPSFADSETLMLSPAYIGPTKPDPIKLQQEGISEELIRVSPGLEHIDDLIADFDRALNQL